MDKRTLTFRVDARDEKEAISDGGHSRVVVNVSRFDARIQSKSNPGGGVVEINEGEMATTSQNKSATGACKSLPQAVQNVLECR